MYWIYWTYMVDNFATDLVGFYFLELATHYKPDVALESFLSEGPPPIYIGLVHLFNLQIVSL